MDRNFSHAYFGSNESPHYYENNLAGFGIMNVNEYQQEEPEPFSTRLVFTTDAAQHQTYSNGNRLGFEHYPSHQTITPPKPNNNRYNKDKIGYRTYGKFSQIQPRNRVVGQRRNQNFRQRQPFVKQTPYRKFKNYDQSNPSNRVGAFGGMEPPTDHNDSYDVELSQQQIHVSNSNTNTTKISSVGNLKPIRGPSRTHQSNATATTMTRQVENCIQENVEFHPSPACSTAGLMYEDVTENSDENDDAVTDLREHLLRKKHGQNNKREPGEIESDEERKEKRQYNGSQNNGNDQKAKVRKIEGPRVNTRSPINKERETSHTPTPKSGRSGVCRTTDRNSGLGGVNYRRASDSNYSRHDDRYNKKKKSFEKHDSYSYPAESVRASCEEPSSSRCHSPRDFYCSETEFTNMKESLSSMKELLRETRNKLLEEKVMGSKKASRTEDEIRELKSQLDAASKRENDLKATIKKLEDDIISNRTELTKMSVLYEVERQDKTKFDHDLTRIYQERLTIEVEKLRALFDIEIAKMHAYYVSPSTFDDNTGFSSMKYSGRELSTSSQQSAQQKMDLVNSTVTGINSHLTLPFARNPYEMTPVSGTSGSTTLYKNCHLNSNYSTSNNLHLQNFCTSSPSSPTGDNTINSTAIAGYLQSANMPSMSARSSHRFSN